MNLYAFIYLFLSFETSDDWRMFTKITDKFHLRDFLLLDDQRFPVNCQIETIFISQFCPWMKLASTSNSDPSYLPTELKHKSSTIISMTRSPGRILPWERL